MDLDKNKSTIKRNNVKIKERTKTTYVDPLRESQSGQETLLISYLTSEPNC